MDTSIPVTLKAPFLNHAHDLKQDPTTGALFFTMEYVEGEPLDARLDRERARGKLPLLAPKVLARLLKGLGEALDYAHEQGVLHRDLKPGNIMLLGGGGVKLMDFGIAKAMGGSGVTQHTGFVGTMGYMAPEQRRGGKAGVGSDVYALGARRT